MRELRLDRKTRYTRMVLKDSLMELMKQKPISKITIKELCEKADLNRTTFYAHYADQFDLLRRIQDETLSWAEEMIATLLAQTDKKETMKVLEGMLRYFADNSQHIQVLMSEQGDIGFQKQLLTLIYRQCGVSPSTAKGADMTTKEYSFIFAVNGSVGLIQHWLKDGLCKSTKELAEIIYNMASQIR